jgi:hypothetical protein
MNNGSKVLARRIVATEGKKVVARTVSKTTAKTIGRTAGSPLFLIADAAEFATKHVSREMGCNEDTSTALSKGVGIGASVGIGAAIGGPVGAAVGAAVWGIGELLGGLFD